MARAAPGPDRLPPPSEVTALRGWRGAALCRPWFDALALHAVARWYLPLSHGWAVAAESGRMPAIARAARAWREAEAGWEAAYFGDCDPGPATLVAAEIARSRAARAHMAGRRDMLWSLPWLPPVGWTVVPPDEAERLHGARLDDAARRFPPPPPVEVAESRRAPSALGAEYWLRFPSVVGGRPDTAWAHVYEPVGRPVRATFIFLHGIAMETELWGAIRDPVNDLTAQGIRVVRPEGPWHGRRAVSGWYGGEPVIARGVVGFVELFESWLAELAVLIAWARRNGGGRVAIGGVSLGALAAQLAACAAAAWPAAMQPDALCLVATSGDFLAIARHGSLGHALAAPARLAAAGWTEAAMQRWRPLVEPAGMPVMGAARCVMVLGTADDLTPFPGGQELARRWQVPADNLFLRRQGHFSVALGLWRDPAPLHRLAALLAG